MIPSSLDRRLLRDRGDSSSSSEANAAIFSFKRRRFRDFDCDPGVKLELGVK